MKFCVTFGKVLFSNKTKFGKAADILDCEYKAARLARTEINMAYRTAEQTRWQQLDFVVGFEVKRSKREFACKVCEALAGKYPKDFHFVGWHPNCRCYVVSILKTKEEFWSNSPTSVNEVKDVPEGFKSWVAENSDRIAEAEKRGTLPYFLRDNKYSLKKDVSTGVYKLEAISNAGKGNLIFSADSEFSQSIASCQSVAEVQDKLKDYLSGTMGQNIVIDFDEKICSLDYVRNFAQQFVNLSDKYTINVPIERISIAKMSDYGQVIENKIAGTKTLIVNGKNASWADIMEKRYSMCDVENIKFSTTTHEFAHLLYSPNSRTNKAFWNDENFMKERDAIWAEYKKKVRDLKRSGKEYQLPSKSWYIGKYGTTTVEEFMAECFSEYMLCSKPSVYAKKMGKLMDRFYKK